MSDTAHFYWAAAVAFVGVTWAGAYVFAQIAKAPIVPNDLEKDDTP